MEGKELVQKLITGSAAIDRMRAEIHFVIHMIFGLVKLGPLPQRSAWEFRSSECQWNVWYQELGFSGASGGLFGAKCWVADDNGVRKGYYPQDNDAKSIALQDVQKVHEALPAFVEGMMRRFPELAKRLQPLLDAAGK